MMTDANREYFKAGVIHTIRVVLTKTYSIEELEEAFMTDDDKDAELLIDKISKEGIERLLKFVKK